MDMPQTDTKPQGAEAAGPNPYYYLTVPGYEDLAGVLRQAYHQAAGGKGADRHAGGQPFDAQPMQTICDLVGRGFALGQAIKKIQESQRMEPDAAKRELLGAIVYLAGAIIHIERSE